MKLFAEVFSKKKRNILHQQNIFQNKLPGLIRKALLPFMLGKAVNIPLVESS